MHRHQNKNKVNIKANLKSPLTLRQLSKSITMQLKHTHKKYLKTPCKSVIEVWEKEMTKSLKEVSVTTNNQWKNV